MKPITVADMKHRILNDCYKGYDFKSSEIAPYHTDIRFDVMGLQRYNREVRIYEIKSCRQDFTSDKKWEKYLPFATYFYFAAPEGVIKASELPDCVGLMEFFRHERGYVDYKYTKKCKKLPPISEENYIKLIEGALVRMIHDQKRLWETEVCGDIMV